MNAITADHLSRMGYQPFGLPGKPVDVHEEWVMSSMFSKPEKSNMESSNLHSAWEGPSARRSRSTGILSKLQDHSVTYTPFLKSYLSSARSTEICPGNRADRERKTPA